MYCIYLCYMQHFRVFPCVQGVVRTFLFGNLSFTMLIVDFYSNWYGCQPLLRAQNHPGPKVHTGTRRHIVRNVKGAQLAKASCQVHSSSSCTPLQLFVVNFLRHLVATWMWRHKTVTHLKKDEKDQEEEGPCRPETFSHQRIIAKMSWQKLKNSAKREIHQVWPPTKF